MADKIMYRNDGWHLKLKWQKTIVSNIGNEIEVAK